MLLTAQELKQYHVFLASPGDVNGERQLVRQFFERYNKNIAQLWNVRFEVVDWENYATIGVGRPQELITMQTLEKYRQSLALVIGIMWQRFGSPTGEAESGTEEEFNWAMENHEKHGIPEIKWFFRKVDILETSADPEAALEAVEQWKKVIAFRDRMQKLENPVFYTEYPGSSAFRDVFEHDLNLWLNDPARPWVAEQAATKIATTTTLAPPTKYYENIEHDYRRLDISGIDNDRTFEIPLSDIYVRLRVMFDEDAPEETDAHESGPIDIQTALLRYPKLVIVGDPGSGKSTFLKYIALMLARSFTTGNANIALEKLCLSEPLPVPIFLSCWDLADFLKQKERARLNTLLEFTTERLAAYDFSLSTDDVERLLESGNCCILFDGLDEVPTDAGRAAVSRLLEDCVERYGDNRYVVTSRIRAYTGDTILKGAFTRCDIQPFDANDRAEFIRNWVALLFKIAPETVEVRGSDAGREFTSFVNAIEDSDRIRPLAVNPLLLTVIAIVHWNRKRLPEQRVDLYDECVDVLLGQRKEAERIQISRKVAALDEQREERTHAERAWVRKRFAEIALFILSQDGDHDEATKADVVELLKQRFFDQGAANEEQAAARATLFLKRQELRSGLLVSRREQSYRFVHLTFQEYLAAWHLSNKEFDEVKEIIHSRLRLAKWFETLQLLGGQWAKESDDKADRYIAWLLDNRGATIHEKAPVVALCANIVRDINGISELTPQTRCVFRDAVETTLDAFGKASGVPANTQLEILEALGQLGTAVKSHLIDATKASLFQVRRRAIEMLLPHLSDDELFDMQHLLEDRSQEPMKMYLMSLMDRDRDRTAKLFEMVSLTGKIADSISLLPNDYFMKYSDALSRQLIFTRAIHGSWWGVRSTALQALVDKWPDEKTRKLLEERSVTDKDHDFRRFSVEILLEKWPEMKTREMLEERAIRDNPDDIYDLESLIGFTWSYVVRLVRVNAFRMLAEKWWDDRTREILEESALKDRDGDVRSATFNMLMKRWPEKKIRIMFEEYAFGDNLGNSSRSSIIRQFRDNALRTLVKEWPDDRTRMLLEKCAVSDKNGFIRDIAVEVIAETWSDESTRNLLEERAVKDDDGSVRGVAFKAITEKWPDERTRKLLEERAVNDIVFYVRRFVDEALTEKWPDERTRKLLQKLARVDIAAALALGKQHSEFGRIVFSSESYRYPYYLDPAEPISRKHIRRAAKKANVRLGKIDETVRSLSEHLGWDITKGARRAR